MTNHNTTILSIIKPHLSFANTVSQHDIANEYMLRCNEPITARRVRRVIEELIEQGEPILSTPHNPGGYCFGGADNEVIQCVQRLRRKGIKILLRARRLKRNSQRGQLKLGLMG